MNTRIAGVGFTLLFAIAGYGLAQLPGLDRVGQLGCAILLAVLYRQLAGYPEALRTGIQYSSKTLLRTAIVLYGLKLNIVIVLQQGLGLLALDAVMVVSAIGLTLLVAKWLKADLSLSLLLGIGTGVCGAAAIAAVSPIVKAKEKDTAIGAGMIALVGTVFAIGYTLIGPLTGLSPSEYGIWSGVSLHEIAHVALAAAPAGEDALTLALLAKLGRVFLLIPLSFVLILWMKRRGGEAAGAKIEFPWFLAGFIGMSLFGSFLAGQGITMPVGVSDGIATVTTFLLTMAMVGLGLNVSLKDFKAKTLRALAAMAGVSVVLSVVMAYISSVIG
ncbi:YeiH family protein [Paenibacillus spongiae]|uniref:Sulfate exporter family transporter n=1 Tax=Paenibacillus spongiae TaxID=2909671 RepID=A0ABY5SIU8_9BACL|nr:putative sulfate exporter family transporter [Paenibacillus spongiae]UVI33569.1 putative sulfate exporter family transporter [Paenibacillus spongiae]